MGGVILPNAIKGWFTNCIEFHNRGGFFCASTAGLPLLKFCDRYQGSVSVRSINRILTRNNRIIALCPIAAARYCDNVQAGEIAFCLLRLCDGLTKGLVWKDLRLYTSTWGQRSASFPFLAISGRIPLLVKQMKRHP